eukprot:TRINITY_DN21296_c0_g4_i1.p1 TRINITY_DN21296_c0_g4~~TRINITY_DN21296_c0_g4_i1.p1  ORF type:complete len:296 (+),score=37.62 TRINITY_DN21296_c0_g4_i1:192-1079(+)
MAHCPCTIVTRSKPQGSNLNLFVGWFCCACFLVTSYRIKKEHVFPRIPRQVLMTVKEGTLDDLRPDLLANVKRNLAQSSGLRLRWLTDADCLAYLQTYNDEELLSIFKGETEGMLRGDLCRAAVLAKEGGFYMDLDLQLNTALDKLVDDKTTFASAFTEDGYVLNAILGVRPGCPIMGETLEQTKKWYRSHPNHGAVNAGTEILLHALKAIVGRDCPGQEVRPKNVLQWDCGPHNLRFFQERQLACTPGGSAECPLNRASSTFNLLKYGIFDPAQSQGALVAWSRYDGCQARHCE